MRIVSSLLIALAVLIAGLAVFVYIWAHGMSCAHMASSGGCRIPPPWEQGGEDLFLLVLMPIAMIGAIVMVALSLRRQGR